MNLKFPTPTLGFRQALTHRNSALKRMNDSVAACKTRAAELLSVHRSKVIVVVDDHLGDRRQIVQWLLECNYEVMEADDAFSLRLLLRRISDVGLVILDLCLPGQDGWELAQEIKRKTPVIYISGAVDEDLEVIARRTGAAGALSKPADRDVLLSMVEKILRPSQPPVLT